MPSPFTHIANAQRLVRDPVVPEAIRQALITDESAFLLGNIAADGHHLAEGLRRDQTHFYKYDFPVIEHPWRIMMAQHPSLWETRPPDSRAFLAGYIAHLSIDEVWWLDLTRPYFGEREWASRDRRFLMLNILLIGMDERDEIPARNSASVLANANPHNWLPFMQDAALIAWRNVIARQLEPNGASETLAVIAPRVNRTVEQLRAMVDDTESLEHDLFAHIPHALVAEVEEKMYLHAREQMIIYWNESA